MTGRLPSEVEEALWDGVARGLLTADGFLLTSAHVVAGRDRTGRQRGGVDAGQHLM